MRQLTVQTFIYYLIYSDARKGFCKLFNTSKYDLACSIEIYDFENLSYCAKQNVKNKLEHLFSKTIFDAK